MCPDRLGRIGSAEAAIKQVLASPFQLQDLPAEEAAELRHDINEVAAMEQVLEGASGILSTCI